MGHPLPTPPRKGDYPGLDRQSKPSSRWWRQAGALGIALLLQGAFPISAVSARVLDPMEPQIVPVLEWVESHDISESHYLPSEPSYVFRRPVKRVVVTSGPPNVQKLGAGLNVYEVLNRNSVVDGRRWNHNAVGGGFWPEESRRVGRYLGSKIMVCWQLSVGEMTP